MKAADRSEKLMPNGIPKYIRCYDNGGKTADRYCVVFTGRYRQKTGGVFWYLTMNCNPLHPQGIGIMSESRQQIDYPTYSHIGKKISFSDLPEDCQKAVVGDYRYLWDIE